MNKDYLNVLQETQKALKDSLDRESNQYLEKEILERKLDGFDHFSFLKILDKLEFVILCVNLII